jgi:hypothetical protein
MNESSQRELKKVKLNAKNIHSVLVNRNKNKKRISASIKREEENQEQRKKLGIEEKQLESPVGTSLDNVKDSVRPSGPEGGGNIFNKLFEFLGLMLAGIIVNALPAIIEKVKEFIDGVTSFFAPVESTFKLIIGFITGQDIGSSEYDADRKRVDSSFKKLNNKGGLAEKMLSAINPIIGLTARLTGALNKGENKKGIVLAKQNEKEGFLNKDTGKFTVKQWTTAEREEYESTKKSSNQNNQNNQNANRQRYPESSGTEPINRDDPNVMVDDHHPSSRRVPSAGGSGVPFEAGTKYKNGKIFLHWTAGAYMDTRGAYHTVFTGDGKTHRNASYNTFRDGHTWGRNNEGVALSIAALGGPTSSGHNPSENDHGSIPIKNVQIHAMAKEIARLALAWDWKKSDIKLGRVYTHAEIAREESPPYGPRSGDPETKWDLWNLKSGGPLWSGGPIIRKIAQGYYQDLKDKEDKAQSGKGGGSLSLTGKGFTGKDALNTISQPMYEELDDEEEMTNVYIQEVNTIETTYQYVPLPRKSKNISSKITSRSKLPAVWST